LSDIQCDDALAWQAAQITAANLVSLGVIAATTQANAVNDVQLNVAANTAVATSVAGTPYGLAAVAPLTPLVGQTFRPVVGLSTTVPTVSGVTQTITFAASCTATAYATVVSALNPRVDTTTDLTTNSLNYYWSLGTPGQMACLPAACTVATANVFPWTNAANQAMTTTCAAAVANTVTSLATTGFVEYAQYLTYPVNTDYTKAVMTALSTAGNNVPYQVNEFPIQATAVCSAYGAGLPLNNAAILWTVAGTTATVVQGSQTVAYTITTTQTINAVSTSVTATYASQLYYSTTACTGAPIGIYTYLSSMSMTPTGGAQKVIAAAGSNVNTGIWVASASFVSGLAATVPFTAQNFYSSQAGCTSSTATTRTWTQYQFPAYGCVACHGLLHLAMSSPEDLPCTFPSRSQLRR